MADACACETRRRSIISKSGLQHTGVSSWAAVDLAKSSRVCARALAPARRSMQHSAHDSSAVAHAAGTSG